MKTVKHGSLHRNILILDLNQWGKWGPTSAITKVATATGSTLAQLFFFFFTITLFKEIVKMTDKYAYKDWVLEKKGTELVVRCVPTDVIPSLATSKSSVRYGTWYSATSILYTTGTCNTVPGTPGTGSYTSTVHRERVEYQYTQ